jgi:spore germination protein GerM
LRKALVIALIAVGMFLAIWYALGRREAVAPLEELSEVARVREITLYFGSRDAGSLVPEHRRIASSEDILENLRSVIEDLIGGPTGAGVSTIPSSTRLLAVYVHDKIAYLDFSPEIADDFTGGTAGEHMLIASIVQTACGNFRGIEGVRILVEGEEVDTIGGHLFISDVLRPKDWR